MSTPISETNSLGNFNEIVENLIESTGEIRFSKLNDILNKKLGRKLIPSERNAISSVIANRLEQTVDKCHGHPVDSLPLKASSPRIFIIMAYSEDYCIGQLCEIVNRSYAHRHCYQFQSRVFKEKDMLSKIYPKQNCTWYKVKFILDLLNGGDLVVFDYLLWIDADAVFINHAIRIETIIDRSKGRDLIVAEDMNPCCLLNAGVILIKNSQWSRDLWTDVWNHSHYNSVFYYEQSALQKCLKSRREGLELIKPFHSYLPGAPCGDKMFAHVAVLPHLDFNSNRGCVVSSRRVLKKINRSKEKLKARIRAHNADQDSSQSKIEQRNKTVGAQSSAVLTSVAFELKSQARPYDEHCCASDLVVSQATPRDDLATLLDSLDTSTHKSIFANSSTTYGSGCSSSCRNTPTVSLQEVCGGGYGSSHDDAQFAGHRQESEVEILRVVQSLVLEATTAAVYEGTVGEDEIHEDTGRTSVLHDTRGGTSVLHNTRGGTIGFHDATIAERDTAEEALFIFHAAGRCDKLASLCAMIAKHNLASLVSDDVLDSIRTAWMQRGHGEVSPVQNVPSLSLSLGSPLDGAGIEGVGSDRGKGGTRGGGGHPREEFVSPEFEDLDGLDGVDVLWSS